MGTAFVPTGSHWGLYEVELADGRIVGARPDPADPEPTPLHRSLPEIVAHPARVLRPAVRASYLARGIGSDRAKRGAEHFVAVSWERALGLFASELARVREDHGSQAVYSGSYGWASSGRLHHPRTLMRRLLGLYGGYTDHVLDYSRGAALVIVPHVLGTADAVGGILTDWESIFAHTRRMVCFGGMAPKNMQLDSGGMGAHRSAQWMQGLRAAGVAVTCVSPLRDDVADTVGADWLAIRPNTDTALMLGLAHTLCSESLHDKAFLARCCTGYERFERYLLGHDDGVPKDARWAGAICQVPAERIVSLARAMAGARTMIGLSYSLQRADHGEQPMWMGIVLAAMLGQIGLPGGGFGIGYGAMGTKGLRRAPVALRSMPAGENPAKSFIPVARISDMLLSPGGQYDFDGERRTYPDIRLVWWGGGNPFHHHQDINRLLRAWRRPETVVVQEHFWTPAARHADIVLPAATALERNDIGAGWFEPTIFAMPKVIDPIGESRSDYDITTALARLLGLEEEFTEGRTEMDWVRFLYDSVHRQMAARGAEVPGFDEFWARGRVVLPVSERPFVAFEAFRRDPDANRLKTPSGKIEIYSGTIAGYGYDDCPGHPAWLAPAEWLGAPLAARFPLHLVSNQPPTRLHSQMDPASYSMGAKVAGREAIAIHPDDARARGIADGELVRVYNDRGECLAGARLTDAIRPGVVCLPTGAWYDPAEPGEIGTLCRHGNPNVLTLDKGTSRLGQSSSAHTALVEVERWTGAAPAVAAHAPPRIVDETAPG